MLAIRQLLLQTPVSQFSGNPTIGAWRAAWLDAVQLLPKMVDRVCSELASDYREEPATARRGLLWCGA